MYSVESHACQFAVVKPMNEEVVTLLNGKKHCSRTYPRYRTRAVPPGYAGPADFGPNAPSLETALEYPTILKESI